LIELIQRQQIAHAIQLGTDALVEETKKPIDGGVVAVQPRAQYSAIDSRDTGLATA
jgi:hypothetical protein